MTQWILRLFAVLLLMPMTASALALKGIDIKERYNAARDMPELVLNGAAIRQKYFVVDVYVGALYLERGSHNTEDILNDPGYKRMEFHLLRSVRGRVIADAIYEGMRLNISKEEAEAMQKEMEDFIQIFDHKINEGELAALDYIPGVGTRIEIAGQQKGIVPGKRLYDAILAIWIGDLPVSENFKVGILGLSEKHQETPLAQQNTK